MPERQSYYVYAYVRSCASERGVIGSPYYIGKGSGKRVNERHNVTVPKNKQYVLYLAKNLSEPDAHQLEVLIIYLYGRIDLGTGCLRNFTNGGDGVSGAIVSEATRQLKRDKLKGKPRPESVKQNMRGKKRTPEQIARIKARVMPDDWLEKVRAGIAKRVPVGRTPEGKARFIESLRNRVIGKETRAKLRANALGNKYGKLSWKNRKKSSSNESLFEFPNES